MTAVETSQMRGIVAEPPRRWPGGKRQLLAQLRPLLPARFTGYHEPFLGMGAMFFDVMSREGPGGHAYVLSDTNEESIGALAAIRDDVEAVIRELRVHRNEEAYYYAIRRQDPRTLPAADAAARFIFLGKACFNGLYRVNKSGGFNAPFGDNPKAVICDEAGLRACARALRDVMLLACRYDDWKVMPMAEGSLVFIDPPYLPKSETADFTAYGTEVWDVEAHRNLALHCQALDRAGMKFMLTNSETPATWEVFGHEGWDIQRVSARRSINRDATKRGAVTELVVRNYR